MNFWNDVIRIKSLMGINNNNRFTCMGCGEKDYHMYMVNNDLWNKYGVGEMTLCKNCFEKVLGRSLTFDDISQYKDAPANRHNPELADLYDKY